MAKAPEQKTLSMSSIQALEGIRIRTRTNAATVTDYAERMKEGVDLGKPEVVTSGDEEGKTIYIVGDGYHRIEAAKALERDKIGCLVHSSRGSFDKDKAYALDIALERNCRHGLPMSSQDKARAVKLALETLGRMSDSALSKKCGVSPQFVAGVRKGKTDRPTSKRKTSVKAHARGVPEPTTEQSDPLQDRINTMKAWLRRGEIDLATIANNIDTKVHKLLLVEKNGKQAVLVRAEAKENLYSACTIGREETRIVIDTE